jgi:hypothetical protein
MPVTPGREANSGQTSRETAFGSIVRETRTFHKDIESSLYLEDALDDDLTLAASSATAQVMAPKDNGDLMMEVRLTNEAFSLGQLQWQFNVSSLQERTTTDLAGDKIVVTYPPSLDWASEITTAQGDTINSFQYTKYESQTGEAEKYIPSCEITGQRFMRVEANGIVNHLTTVLRPWFYTINSVAFMGFEIGCVLCLGVDFRPVAKRPDGSWICEERYKFMTRPGHPLSNLIPEGAPEGSVAGGWNTWHLWKDPNSGVIPDDVWDKITDGAVVEVRHYELKDFTVLYAYS